MNPSELLHVFFGRPILGPESERTHHMKREQITVPLDPALRAFVEREAEREDRTMAAWIRRLVAQAQRQAQGQQQERAA